MVENCELPAVLRERARVIDRNAIRAYAEITDDFNPIHVDPEFAARSPLGGIIAHGMLSLNLVWESLCDTLGPAAVTGTVLDIRFMRPVRENDEITAGGSLVPETAGYTVWAKNQKGEVVLAGALRLAHGASA